MPVAGLAGRSVSQERRRDQHEGVGLGPRPRRVLGEGVGQRRLLRGLDDPTGLVHDGGAGEGERLDEHRPVDGESRAVTT